MRSVRFLSLGNNNITSKSCDLLSELLRYNKSIIALFLRWNLICAEGMIKIAEGLERNNTMQILDVSFNRFGSAHRTIKSPRTGLMSPDLRDSTGSPLSAPAQQNNVVSNSSMLDGSVNAAMASQGGKSIGRAIGSMFKHNRSLVHVDLSHTGLTKEDCKDIVEGGLRRNHHVLGLHMIGNEMDTDALGFLSFPGSHPSVSHIFMRIHSTLETGVVRDKRMALRSSSNCWICEGWS